MKMLCLLVGFLIMLPRLAPAQELIILFAPDAEDEYYAPFYDDILEFQLSFAQKIEAHGDRALILADPVTAKWFETRLETGLVFSPGFDDIWARDFSPANIANPIQFRYTAAGQGGDQWTADEVQHPVSAWLREVSAPITTTRLLNDGGNLVDDFAGNVVVSTKFMADNALSEESARAALRGFRGIENVAFIEADEQGGLEHADGVVSFIDTKTLIVNDYGEDPDYEADLYAALRRGLPDVALHRVVSAYTDAGTYDERFGSACGLYTNALVTEHRIYLPQFGFPEDQIALEQVAVLTDKEIVPVASHHVCHMGGGVRCMSWQARGRQAEAILASLEEGL